MKYYLTAYNHGRIIETKHTDDYQSARRFYRQHECVRATVNGKTMTYPKSDSYFKVFVLLRVGKVLRKNQDMDDFMLDRSRKYIGYWGASGVRC